MSSSVTWPLWYLGGVLWATHLVVSDVVVWYPAVDISDTQLASGWLEQIWTRSERTCAMLATHTASCHLFHYQDGLCSLSDVNVSYSTVKTLSISQPPPPPTTSCRTRYDKVCFTADGIFNEGETYLLGSEIFNCQGGVSVPAPASAVECSLPFTAVPNMGCVYLKESLMTWADGRNFCNTFGGDLYSLGNQSSYSALQDYLGSLTNDNVWVGVNSRKWLNGNNVSPSQWYPGMPNGVIDSCARMVKRLDYQYLLDDASCANTFFILCQVPGM